MNIESITHDRITIIHLRVPNNVDSYRNAPVIMQFLTARDYSGLKKAIYNVYLNAEKVGNGSLRTLTKLLDNNQNLSRKKLKFTLAFVREFKVEAEALMDDESQKAKISDFQIFKWVEGTFEMNTRDQHSLSC
jgi:hypothetical protein